MLPALASTGLRFGNFVAVGIALKRVVQRLRLFRRRLKLDVGNDATKSRRLAARKGGRMHTFGGQDCRERACRAAAATFSPTGAGADAYFAALHLILSDHRLRDRPAARCRIAQAWSTDVEIFACLA